MAEREPAAGRIVEQPADEELAKRYLKHFLDEGYRCMVRPGSRFFIVIEPKEGVPAVIPDEDVRPELRLYDQDREGE